MYGRLGSDLTIIANSSHSFVVFDFSFDVLSQDCMSNFGRMTLNGGPAGRAGWMAVFPIEKHEFSAGCTDDFNFAFFKVVCSLIALHVYGLRCGQCQTLQRSVMIFFEVSVFAVFLR